MNKSNSGFTDAITLTAWKHYITCMSGGYYNLVISASHILYQHIAMIASVPNDLHCHQ